MIDNNIIKEIEAKANIVDVVSTYVDLQKRGRNYWGLCPFHQDTTPSMSVSPDKGIFKCFTCGAGGSSISFIKKYKNLSFPEAVIEVAELIGMNTSSFKSAMTIKKDMKAEKLYEINKVAADYYHLSLISNNGKKAMQYLVSRKITQDDIKKFEIGYSPLDNSLTAFLLKKGYEIKLIIEAGLGYLVEDELVDQFKNRIMFTIKNVNGNILGFSGRCLQNNSNFPKYINTKETYVFKKSKILYNANLAFKETNISKEIFICEGFTDVIAMTKSDFKNTVAIMGTALTNDHVKLLSKHVKTTNLVLDGDSAGVKAAFKSLEMLNSTNLERVIRLLPNKTDIDDIYQKDGKNGVNKALQKNMTWMKFELSFLRHTYKDDVAKMANEMIKRLKFINNEIEKNLYANEIVKMTQLDINLVLPKKNKEYKSDTNHHLHGVSHNESKSIFSELPIRKHKLLRNDLAILSMILDDKTALEMYNKQDYSLNDKSSNIILTYIRQYKLSKTDELRKHINVKNDIIINRLSEIDEVKEPYKKFNKDIFNELLARLRRK